MLEITAAIAVVLAFIYTNRPTPPVTVPAPIGPGRYTLVVDTAKNRELLLDTQTGATYERNSRGHWSPFADPLKQK